MLHTYKSIHFIGIGGIGMSALAAILHNRGHIISGCDINLNQASVASLSAMGCTINSHGGSSCLNSHIDLFVYSSDIRQDLAEIRYASDHAIPLVHRACILAWLMAEKQSIAIAGSHGKTTTTALISHIFLHAGYDPTIIIGGIIHSLGSNARTGNGPHVIAEADESDRSFLQLHPQYAVITNIDREHLDTYVDLHDIQQTFVAFLETIKPGGKAFICIDDEYAAQIAALDTKKRIITYGLSQSADITATNLILAPTYSTCTVLVKTQNYQEQATITLPLAGTHNIQNTLAAIAVACHCAIPLITIASAIATFSGVDRRFSFRGTYNNALIFDDYGHHPVEITKTLIVARQNAKKRLVVIFQPHRFSRTAALWNAFIDAFCYQPIDHLIITDVYSAGEAPIIDVSGKQLAEAINKANPSFCVEYIPLSDLLNNIKPLMDSAIQSDDLLLFQGAGNIVCLGQLLLS